MLLPGPLSWTSIVSFDFKNVADEWEFDPETFVPYAPLILARIMSLIEDVELTETKMALLNTVGVVIERMDYLVCEYSTTQFYI